MKFETRLMAPSGWEHIVTVEYTEHKAERQTRDYPGCPAYIEIESITYAGEDGQITDEDEAWLETKGAEEQVLENLLEEYEKSEPDHSYC